MESFSLSTQIHSPTPEVWKILSDVGTIAQWNPGVKKSYLTSDIKSLGATRHCELPMGRSLDEDVVEWEEGKRITFRIEKSNLPFKSADIRFTLESQGDGTKVTVSPVYEMKYGALGRLMNKVMVERSYRKGMKGLLDGLKSFSEKNSP